MKGLIALLKLSRPVNLLIIAATMYAIRWLLIINWLEKEPQIQGHSLSEFYFFLSVLVMILLAAAGNIINDYFDQKVDRINRPEKVIVGRLVKRRVAIVLHQILNGLAVFFTALIALKTGWWWSIFVPIVMAGILWLYSPVFKKKPFIGNLIVAICVAIVPWWAGVFELQELRTDHWDALFNPEIFFSGLNMRIEAYVIFAFLITLSREAVKDMEDLEGDSAELYKTLPIVWGEANTRFYSVLIQVIAVCGVVAGAYLMYDNGEMNGKLLVAISVLLIIQFFTILKTYLARNKIQYGSASTWHKIVMAGGLGLLFFL